MKKKMDVNVKSFLSGLLVVFLLMVISYVLTLVLPGGMYERYIDASGNELIDTSVAFKNIEGGLPFYKFLLSPLLSLTISGGAMTIAIIIFLLVIGGIFKCLEVSKIMNYLLNKITYKFINKRYKLLCVVSLFFMLMGSLMGSFEEIIPIVPIMVSLCVSLGFDNLTGISISILAGSCGFSCGIMNPFTVGIAQKLAGLPMFSGIGYRIVIFVLVYILLISFILLYAKKIAKDGKADIDFKEDELLNRAANTFVIILGIGIVCVLLSCVITFLQDFTLYIVALMFLVGGIVACKVAKMPVKEFFKNFKDGAISIAPATLMILMASSIKYILIEGKILDTILNFFITLLTDMPRVSIVIFIYLIFLIMELFIPSGSAKVFLLMPLILPIAQVFNISSRIAVLCFAFGDGFSNVLYPTNPGLLVSLSLADVSYPKWIKYSYKFFITNFLLTVIMLLIGLQIGY